MATAARREETREIPILEVLLVSRGTEVRVVREYKVKVCREMPLVFLLITRLPLDLHALGYNRFGFLKFFVNVKKFIGTH